MWLAHTTTAIVLTWPLGTISANTAHPQHRHHQRARAQLHWCCRGQSGVASGRHDRAGAGSDCYMHMQLHIVLRVNPVDRIFQSLPRVDVLQGKHSRMHCHAMCKACRCSLVTQAHPDVPNQMSLLVLGLRLAEPGAQTPVQDKPRSTCCAGAAHRRAAPPRICRQVTVQCQQ